MEYKVVIPKKAQKNLDKIDSRYKPRILIALTALAKDPYLGKRLKGERKGEWSFEVWPYRIVYKIKRKQLVVLVIRVGHRQGVY